MNKKQLSPLKKAPPRAPTASAEFEREGRPVPIYAHGQSLTVTECAAKGCVKCQYDLGHDPIYGSGNA